MKGRRLTRRLRRVLLEVRGGGTRLVLVTGRCVKEASRIVGQDLFDVMVAENGAVLAFNGFERRVEPRGWTKVRERLLPQLGRGCEEVIISAEIGRLATARRLIPGQARIELNKDRFMVLPRGVTKGRGLLMALSTLGLPPKRTACLGDGENDVSMFDAVGIRVALNNSVEELKEKADFVTAKSEGGGAIEAVERLFPRSLPGARGGRG